jgi:hypothetical protein
VSTGIWGQRLAEVLRTRNVVRAQVDHAWMPQLEMTAPPESRRHTFLHNQE